jgi:subtilase family serine protease
MPKGLPMHRNKVFLSVCLLAVLASLFLLVTPMAQAQNARPVLITQNVDESKSVTLAGNTRPEAKKQNDRGLVADSLSMEHMLLQLKRSPEQERELRQLIDELQDSSSPNFHHWLTAKEFGERFGLATQDLGAITRWLESHGLKVNVVYESGMLVDFSGTAGQVREAFHTEIHELNVKGVKHIANMSDPRIPSALAPAVVGVVSLHDFMPHPMYKPRANYTTSGGYYAVVPADLATIYNLNPLFNASPSISGQGQTVVVIEDTDVYSTADWTTFRSTFGLSSYTGGSFTQVHPAPPSGGNNCANPGVNGAEGEAIIDAEWASASAPSAAIELASCSDTQTTFGGLIALQNLLNESATPPALVSISYGECEVYNGASANQAYRTAYQQAVTEGVSVFVAAGDEGAAMCDAGNSISTQGIAVSAFASTPYNVAVGGTDFGDTYAGTNSTYWSATNSSTYESALSYVPEIPWNGSCASVLAATFEGYSQTYGSDGFCNSAAGANFIDIVAGSGGPSGCATGSPSVSGVVSGTCAGWPKPSWQSLVGNPSDTVRDIPDVSLFAANGVWGHYYPFCDSNPSYGYSCTGTPDTWIGAGGTSFASPIMAGIQALVNQNAGGRQGNPNPAYYSLAATEYGASGDSSCNSTLGNTAGSSCIFYDVTQGDMDVPCVSSYNCYLPSGTYGVLSTSNSAYQPAYGTTTGWDFATGIGSVNAANLVNNWPNILPATTTTVTSSQNPADVGVAVTFTATVTTKGTNPPTGTVTFNDGATALGTGTLSAVSGSQMATFTTSALAVGAHLIAAVYGGDTNNAPSTSPVLTQTITLPPTTTTLAANPSAIPSGASVTFTATVTGSSPTGTPTGTVNFHNGASSLGTVALSGGVATLTTTALVTIGANSITAGYGGDAHSAGSTSNTLTETVSAATFTMPAGSATPATQTISSGGTATIAVAVTTQGIYTSPITFTATLTPTSNAQLSWSSNPVTPNGGTATTTLTITGATAAAISRYRRAGNVPLPSPRRNGTKLSALNASALWTPLGLTGILLLGRRKKGGWRVARQFLLAAALVVIALTMFGCGSGSTSHPQTYQVQINATAAASGNSGAVTTSTTVAFIIQ